MKLNEPQRQNSWQRAEHAKVQSDLPPSQKRERLIALDFQSRESSFLRPQYPTKRLIRAKKIETHNMLKLNAFHRDYTKECAKFRYI